MRYLTVNDILIIHALVVEATGGSHGVRDTHLLHSIVHRPQGVFAGKELFPGVFLKAAVYLEAIARYHVFIDGNKRTAIAAAARFLALNNYNLHALNTEVEIYLVRVVEEKIEAQDIAVWIKRHSKKKRRGGK